MTDFVSAAAATRQALRPTRDRGAEERALKASKLVDTRGPAMEAVIVARNDRKFENVPHSYTTTVFFPRPSSVPETELYFEIETYKREALGGKQMWVWAPPATENAKFRIWYGKSYQIKENMNAPTYASLRHGDVVTVVGIRYERVRHLTTGREIFSITCAELRPNDKRAVWDFADPNMDLTQVLRLNAELSNDAFAAFQEDYLRINGVAEDYHSKKHAENPNDPYLVCRHYFVLPIDQAFAENEVEMLQRRESGLAVMFNTELDGRDSYVGASATAGEQEQRMIRAAIRGGGAPKTGSVTFVVKQNRFGDDGTLQTNMVKVRMPVYAEELLVVPTVKEWEGVGPVLARGAVGALVVTPKTTIDMGEALPHMEVHGNFVWDLRRTVQNVGVEVTPDTAKELLMVMGDWDVVGKPIDEKPRTSKVPNDVPIPLRHVRPCMDCVNLRLLKGNIKPLIKAVEEKQASLVMVGHGLEFEDFAQIQRIRAIADDAERTQAYQALGVRLPKNADKKDYYQIFAVAHNVMQVVGTGAVEAE